MRIVREDKIRGTFVAQVVNAVSGSLMTIIADDTCVPTDIWVLDRSAFSMRWLQPIYDWDPQDGAFDGVRRSTRRGNVRIQEHLSRAAGSTMWPIAATALASVRAKGATVTVANTASNPVNTKAVTE